MGSVMQYNTNRNDSIFIQNRIFLNHEIMTTAQDILDGMNININDCIAFITTSMPLLLRKKSSRMQIWFGLT